MIEEELIKIWQSSPNQERIKFEKSRLIIEVQGSMDSMHRKIKFRDMSEQIAILLGAPVFAYFAFTTPYLLSRIASVLVVVWGVYIIFRLKAARKHKPSAFTETYLEYLYKTKEYLHIQKHLLESIVYWYILPGFLLVSLFLLGPIGEPEKMPAILKTLSGNVVFAVVLYFLNRRAVDKELAPRLNKVEELITVMERS